METEYVNRPSLKVVPAFGGGKSTSDRGSIVAPAGGPLPRNASEALVELLEDLGVQHAFGLLGGAIAPFGDALHRSTIEMLHFRHESGACYAAIESSIASGRPVVVFGTTGPGLTNCFTGMVAARWEGAKVIFVTGTTGTKQRGRWAFQESSAFTLPISGLFTSGALFHYAGMIESVDELPPVASRLAAGVVRPNGFVAHLGCSVALQTSPADTLRSPRITSMGPPVCDLAATAACAAQLARGSFAIWVGFGARGAAAEIRKLVERTGARVMCTPRGKGVFPESHPNFLGVTGLGGHDAVEEYIAAEQPDRILVLGTRLGEFASFWTPELIPPAGFIHVDLDTEAFGTAYPTAKTVGVQSEIRVFVGALLDNWPAKHVPSGRLIPVRASTALEPREGPSVRPSYLMSAIQQVVVEGSKAAVITEAGNAFVFGSHCLHFDEPGRYRVSTGFGAMGHATGGVVGVALARREKAVAIVGDGAMLMQNEVSTAVQYGIDAVWVVMNDARYGMIEQGMRSLDWKPFATEIPPCDFVMIARGMGADGVRVECEADLVAALEAAMLARGPFVLDVVIDPTEMAPSGRRNKSLRKQGIDKVDS